MTISKLTLNPRNAAARRDLASPYDLHRTLKRAYPGGEPEDNRLLFRVDRDRPQKGPGTVVLVQASTAPPDWSFLREEPFGGNGAAYSLACDGPKDFAPALAAGQSLAFRLQGNATKKAERRVKCNQM